MKCEVSFCKETFDKNKQGWDSLRLTGKYLCRYHMRLEMRDEFEPITVEELKFNERI